MIKIAAYALPFFALACVTPDGVDPSPPPPGLAFQYELIPDVDRISYNACTVTLSRELGDPVRIEITFKKGMDRVIARVPEGSYQIKSSVCDRGSHIKITAHTPIKVPHDGVIFLGTIKIDRFRATADRYEGSLTIDTRSIEANHAVLQDLKDRGLKPYWYGKASP